MDDGCLYTIDEKNLITYPNALENTSFTIKKNVNILGRAFYQKTKLKTVIIEDGEEDIYIACECFKGSKIEKIVLPSNLYEIGADALKVSTLKELKINNTTSSWKIFNSDKIGNIANESNYIIINPFTEDYKENKKILNVTDKIFIRN